MGRGGGGGGKNRGGKAPAKGKAEERQKRKESAKDRARAKWSVPAKDLAILGKQLHSIGLTLRDVVGDGNCLFRALSDQLYGDESHHVELRAMTVAHIRAHKEFFEPFRESEKEDETFEEYVDDMAQDGVYVGNWALVGFSQLTSSSVVIHQVEQPTWTMHPMDTAPQRTLHVAYFGFEHYASVRASDHVDGPANVHVETSGIALSAPAKAKSKGSRSGNSDSGINSSSQSEAPALSFPTPKKAPKTMSKQQMRQAKKLASQSATAAAAADQSEDAPTFNERMLMESAQMTDIVRARRLLEENGGDLNLALDAHMAEEEEEEKEMKEIIASIETL